MAFKRSVETSPKLVEPQTGTGALRVLLTPSPCGWTPVPALSVSHCVGTFPAKSAILAKQRASGETPGPVVRWPSKQRQAGILRDSRGIGFHTTANRCGLPSKKTMSAPKLDILPRAQRRLWQELRDTPREFVLYGGTALALRLGHRTSEDFDFFSNRPFSPDVLRKRIGYIDDAEIRQLEENTLTVIVNRDGPVKVSFFGGLKLNRVQDPDVMPDNGIKVASIIDIAATKLATVQQRAQARDYEDVLALANAGVGLPQMLAAAEAVYGSTFNGTLSLKALTFFSDGDLPTLSPATQLKLRTLASQVNLQQIPIMQARMGITGDVEP